MSSPRNDEYALLFDDTASWFDDDAPSIFGLGADYKSLVTAEPSEDADWFDDDKYLYGLDPYVAPATPPLLDPATQPFKLLLLSSFAGAPWLGTPSSAPGTSSAHSLAAGWRPQDDAPITSGMYLPGAYSTTGTAGVDQTATWLDISGNAYHFVYNNTIPWGPGVTAPNGAFGYPIFDGVNGALVCVGVSMASDISPPGFTAFTGGAVVLIVSHDSPLEADVGNYQNSCALAGSGATPALTASDAGYRVSGYDGIGYIGNVDAGFAADTPYVIAAKWDSVGVYRSRAGADWSAVTPYNAPQTAFGAGGSGPDTLIGIGYGSAYRWKGSIRAVAFYPTAAYVDAAKLAQWQAWAVRAGMAT